MPESFHFLQPLWFLALIPLALWLWLAQRQGDTDSSWRRVCDRHLLPYVVNNPVRHAGNLGLWLLAVTALADPVWQKRPQPVYRNQQALVVVLDLSRSMSSGDLKPSRLDRARYKVADILKIAGNKLRHDQPLHDVGIDSLMAMELATAIENHFGVEIPLMALADNATIESLARHLREALAPQLGEAGQSAARDAVVVLPEQAADAAGPVSAEQARELPKSS